MRQLEDQCKVPAVCEISIARLLRFGPLPDSQQHPPHISFHQQPSQSASVPPVGQIPLELLSVATQNVNLHEFPRAWHHRGFLPVSESCSCLHHHCLDRIWNGGCSLGTSKPQCSECSLHVLFLQSSDFSFLLTSQFIISPIPC